MAKIIPLYNTNDSAWVDIQDEATPYLRYLASSFPREMKSAMKSLGWYLREKIVKGLESSSPGGRTLAPLSLIQRIRLLDAIRTVKKRKRKAAWARGTGSKPDRFYSLTTAKIPRSQSGRPYGRKMVKAVRYLYDEPAKSVHIGWVTPTATSYARALAAGMRGAKHKWHRGPQVVTQRMRKLFAAAGITLKQGKTLKTPERPVIDPVFQRHKNEIPGYLEEKVSQWLHRSLYRSTRYHAAKAVMGNTAAFRRFARYAA